MPERTSSLPPRWIDEFSAVRTSFETAAPHHGTLRLIMRVGSFALPSIPDAPQLTGRNENGTARLEWSTPAQQLNGYRVEYRIGDGLWNEIEAWLDPGQRTLSMTMLRPWEPYAFRVPAFNDAGAGSYSAPAAIRAGRRRVVR